MLPLSIVKNRGLTGSFILAVVAFLAFGAFLFFNTLYLQEVRGMSPLRAGLLILPTTAVALFLSPISGHLTGTRGARFPAGLATVLTAIGMVLLALTLSATTPIYLLLIAYLLVGFGQGLINPPLTNAAVSGLPRDQAGVAGAIMTTARQIGSNLGIALVGAVIFSVATSLNDTQHVVNRALSSLHGGANYVVGVRYGDLLAGVLSLLTLGVAWYAFAPRFEGTRDLETGQFIASTTGRPA
jgi:MFS family permease